MLKKCRKTMLTLFTVALVSASAALPVTAAPKVQDVDYEGKGRVEVEFTSDVSYRNPGIKVKDSEGKTVPAKIVKKTDDEVTFRIRNYKKGGKYTYVITGILASGETAASKVRGKVTIPKTVSGITVQSVVYKAAKKEVEIEFLEEVEWKNAGIEIRKDNKGTSLVRKIASKEDDEIKASVKKLEKGETYWWRISGIRKKGTGAYGTISGRFTVSE